MDVTLALYVVGEGLDPQCVSDYFGISLSDAQKSDLKHRGKRPPFVVRKGSCVFEKHRQWGLGCSRHSCA